MNLTSLLRTRAINDLLCKPSTLFKTQEAISSRMAEVEELILVDPDSKESPTDIALHNLKIGDSKLHLALFANASAGWIKADRRRTMQDLEKLCRSHNFNTHVIAKKTSDKLISWSEKTEVKLEYEAWFSCRPQESALKELLTFHNSYKENFEALEKTGIKCVDSRDEDTTGNLEVFDPNFWDHISNNKKKIRIVLVTLTEIIGKRAKLYSCRSQ